MGMHAYGLRPQGLKASRLIILRKPCYEEGLTARRQSLASFSYLRKKAVSLITLTNRAVIGLACVPIQPQYRQW